jgi:glutamyl/glutaminyl-tRNA synthetase
MKNKILFLGTLLFITGCGVMPYNDDFSCQGGKNTKICASVSDVYLMDDEQLNKRNNHLLQEDLSPEVQESVIGILTKQNKILNYQKQVIQNENQNLKRIIENVEMSKLEKPIIIFIKNSKNDINKTKILNKSIKVCVLNANVRKKPSCKSKVVKVLHKGDSVFALYEKNEWIKLKNGTFIHKSITNLNYQNGSLK